MEDFKNEFSWSKSRDEVFRECRRKYWFNYYGFWGGWNSTASDRVKRIYYLKQLRTKEVWLGALIHNVVEFILRRFRSGEAVSLGHALAVFRAKFEDGFLKSSLKEYTGFASKVHKFFEDEYGIEISDEERDAMLKKGELCLTNFFNSDVFLEIRRTPISDWITFEDFLSFDFEGTKIFLSLDFAMKKGGRFLIYDWKTGAERVADVDLQLSFYVLYFARRFGISASEIEARVFNLGLDKVDVFDIDESRIKEMKSYVRDSVGGMKNLLEAPSFRKRGSLESENLDSRRVEPSQMKRVDGNLASENKFTKWFSDKEKPEDFAEGACRRCVFRKVCLGEWKDI